MIADSDDAVTGDKQIQEVISKAEESEKLESVSTK